MAASYFLGATTALISHVDIQHSDTSNGCISTADVDARVREKVEEELKSQRKQTENDSSIGIASTSAGEESKESIPRFPSTMAGYLAGQARVSRADYLNKFEYGTALDHNMNNNGKKEVFILYHLLYHLMVYYRFDVATWLGGSFTDAELAQEGDVI